MKDKKVGIGIAVLIAVLGAVLLMKRKPPIPPENIILSNLTISPSEVYVGDQVSISVVATNIGGTAGSYEITCGGDVVMQKTVTLAPDESKVVSFEVTPTVAKTYQVSVDGLIGSFVAVTIVEQWMVSVSVRDYYTMERINGATVVLVGIGSQVTVNGFATFYNVPEGTYTISATAPGYLSVTYPTVEVVYDRAVNFYLKPS